MDRPFSIVMMVIVCATACDALYSYRHSAAPVADGALDGAPIPDSTNGDAARADITMSDMPRDAAPPVDLALDGTFSDGATTPPKLKLLPPTGTTANLAAIWGSSQKDVFAAGQGGEMLHYDGLGWTPMSTSSSASVLGLWGRGPTDVWAVGMAGTILHYDGAWAAEGSNTTEMLLAIGGDSSQIIAVGNNGTALQRTSVWTDLSPPSIYPINALAPVPPAGVLVVGSQGTILLLQQWSKQWVVESPPTVATLTGIWCGPQVCWAVGAAGTILRRESGSWSSVTSPAGTALRAVSGASPNDVLAVGNGGTVIHFDGISWSALASPTTADLLAVWSSASGHHFAVGSGGEAIFGIKP